MDSARIRKLLGQKESMRLEFKEARRALPDNLFDTVCAMLNRDGGDIFLGVDDKGHISGIDPTYIDTITDNLVNLSNNPQKLDPPFILFPQRYIDKDKMILHIQVPQSSQLHKSAGAVYDRSEDGDFKVTQPHRIAELYNRKQLHYTEGMIFPALRFEDFNADLFPRIRNLIRSNNIRHPWLELDDRQILMKAGLFRRDPRTGQEGYTLAAALLLGRDEVIQQVVPHYKIDALVRKIQLDRYDDREYIQTNLIDAYDRLLDFVAKHLPDVFFMEGDQRISLRARIFREVVANLLVHREYTNALPATFCIYKDRVEVENANNPHGEGQLSLENFTPYSKNPLISKFFMQLGRVEELGSGFMNVHKYLGYYTPKKKPQFIEGVRFRTVIPLDETRVVEYGRVEERINREIIKIGADLKPRGATQETDRTTEETTQETGMTTQETIMRMLREDPSITQKEMASRIGLTPDGVKFHITRLKKMGFIGREGPTKKGRWIVIK
jgi:ATP-dependent DNA helicase RecG